MTGRSGRLPALAVAALLVAAPAFAQDEITRWLGRPLTDVELTLDGRVFDEAQVLEAVETRIGEPLSLREIRETIDHLIGLGRFQGVDVVAEDAGDGVRLRYDLTPLRRVEAFRFTGAPALSERELRAELSERFGTLPQAARVTEMAATLRAYYAERGYSRASVTTTLEPRRRPERVTAVFHLEPGPRLRVASAVIDGAAGEAGRDLLARLSLQPGGPYDRPAIEARLAAHEERLRAEGYYEASVTYGAVPTDDGVALSVLVDPGPRVRVVFTGDPLTPEREAALAPIRRERSVDEDLLEDASRNIETALRAEGYRAAEAPYTRREIGFDLIVTFDVSRGPLHRVESVDLAGAVSVPRADLQPLLRLEAGERFVDARVGAIAGAIAEVYRVRGFASARVTPDVRVRADANADGERRVAVTFQVEEGPQALVSDVRFEGAQAIAPGALAPLTGLGPGRPFYAPQLAADRDAIERAYRNAGYQSAVVDASTAVTADGTGVSVAYRISEGPQTIVDHILVTGNQRTSAETIRREITLRPGEPLGYDALLESQRRLSALGVFRRVRITDLPHGGSVNRDVLVEVEEAPATTVAYGGGLEVGQSLRRDRTDGVAEERIDIAPRAFFEVGRRNLWGKNRAVNLFTRVSLRPRDPGVAPDDPADDGGYGLNEYRVIGTFREPRAFGTNGDAQITAFLEQAIRASFNFNRRGIRGEYAKRLTPHLTASARYTYDRTRLFDTKILPDDQLLIDRLFPQVRLSTVAMSVLRDSRDDVLDPHRGAVVGVDGEVAIRPLGSEVGYTKTFLQGFLYRRVASSGFVVAGGARVGLARGFERSVPRTDDTGRPVLGPDGQPVVDVVQDLPASERFFAGGDTTVRGFPLDRLGSDATLNADGFPTGGSGLVVLNLELRAPYWKGLGLVTFVDAGNVFQRTGDINAGDLRAATGLGVRYRSPLGPLRLDVGFKLDRRPVGSGLERRAVLHLSLGQAF